jgi:phosphoglycolate phosphatase-like HAD superfamily hydrolase
MEKMQTAPQQTVMIGDAVSDILMARKTGARTIAVSWGFQSEKRLKQADPDALARKPEDLPEILTRWFF